MVEFESLKGSSEYKNIASYMVGSGNMSLALRAEYQAALKIVREELGVDYVRGHGILSDVTALCQERPGFPSPYNFTYVDQIYDAILAVGTRPVIELSFTPDCLKSGPETVFYWKGNITIPADYGKWVALIQAFTLHLLARYGQVEVETWLFEVWNEPNFEEFWVNPDLDEYFTLYAHTYRAIKSIAPNLLVGGPATDSNGDEFLEAFLLRAKAEGIAPDFVTRHIYTSYPANSTPEFDYQAFKPASFAGEKVRRTRNFMDKNGYSGLPLYVTEMNTSYTPKNPVHDTIWQALMVASILAECLPSLDGVAYWTFCDVFEELGIPSCFFHGGFGLLSYGLIKKPVFYTFKFFRALLSNVLCWEDGFILTSDGERRVVALIWNHGMESIERTCVLPGPSTSFFLLETRVGSGYADPRAVWAAMGYPRYPGRDQIEVLRRAAQPAVCSRALQAPGGRAELCVTAAPGEMLLIECEFVISELDGYKTLNDKQIFKKV